MKLSGVERREVDGNVRLSGWSERSGSAPVEVYFAFPSEHAALVADHADAFVPALLLPAMAEGAPLEIDAPISDRMWTRLPQLQEILATWYPDVLRVVTVRAHERVGSRRAATGRTAAFFSMGVDSFHTLLRHEGSAPDRERITHLIHMTGFESALRKGGDGRARPVAEGVQRVARRYAKAAICGETNLRDVFSLGWGPHYHGAGIAATALALSGGLDRALIPSSFAWHQVLPWPSSPILDPLWSTEDLEILHDGTAVDRARKLFDTIARHPEALRELRVCNKYGGGAGNCGACNKCVRTMVTLEIAGALRGSGAFPAELPRDFWRYLELRRSGARFEEDNLRLARDLGAPRWIVAGIERAIRLAELETMRRRHGSLRSLWGPFELAWERTFGDELQRRRRRARRERVAADLARSRSAD